MIEEHRPWRESFWKFTDGGKKCHSTDETDADFVRVSTSNFGEMDFYKDDQMRWPLALDRLRSMLNDVYALGAKHQQANIRKALGI